VVYDEVDFREASQTFVNECIGDGSGNIKPVEFLASAIKFNLTLGSKESVELLNKLANIEDIEILRTNLNLFIDYKWEKFSYIFKI
jgi:hypothetical protein